MKHAHCCWLAFLFLLAACPAAGLPESQTKVEEKNGLLIEYAAPFRHIALTADFLLSDIEEMPEYSNPVSAVPSKMTKVEKTAQVSAAEADELLQLIRQSGFERLKDAYGAGSAERGYPHRILVRDGEKTKEVVCRSSPAAEACPDVFANVEKSIIEFARKAVEPNTGE
jgi:hypothetical protein